MVLGVVVTQLGAPDPVTPADRQVRLAANLDFALARVVDEATRWDCELPHRAHPHRPAEPAPLAFSDTTPTTPGGGTGADGAPKPVNGFGTGPGQNARGTLTGSLAGAGSADTYSFTLRAGEVFAATTKGAGGLLEVRDPAGTLVEGSPLDRSGIYPATSPLLGGGNATVDHVAAVTGVHTVTVRRAPVQTEPGAPAPAPGAAVPGAAPGGAAGPGAAGPGAPAPKPAVPAAKPTPPKPGAPLQPAALPTTTAAAAPADQGTRVLPDTAIKEGAVAEGAALDPGTPGAAAPEAAPGTAARAGAPGAAPAAPPAKPGADAAYVTEVGIYKPAQPVKQRIVLEFGGATVDVRRFGIEAGNASAKLSPLSSYLAGWGLEPADQPALTGKVADIVRENLSGAVGGGPVDVVEATQPGASPFGQPGVSRVVVGGSAQEVGIPTVGISESVDPGNFAREETALVLLDRLSGPSTQAVSLGHYLQGDVDKRTRIEFVGRALGNIASHEAGHFLGSWHTDADSGKHDVMAPGDVTGAFGFGADGRGGTTDDLRTRFGQDSFAPQEGFSGTEDTRTRTMVGLTGKPSPSPN